jgi:hypothetical protein
MMKFSGNSQTGNFQEALDRAIAAALDAAAHKDPQVSFVVKEIGGRNGGYPQLKELTVVIEGDVH